MEVVVLFPVVKVEFVWLSEELSGVVAILVVLNGADEELVVVTAVVLLVGFMLVDGISAVDIVGVLVVSVVDSTTLVVNEEPVVEMVGGGGQLIWFSKEIKTVKINIKFISTKSFFGSNLKCLKF